MVTLYEHIEEMGKRAGYKNMTDLCTAANVSRSVMSELRSGRSKDLSKPNGMKFAATLNVPLDSIYNLETTEKPATNEGSGLSRDAVEMGRIFDAAVPEIRAQMKDVAEGKATAKVAVNIVDVKCPIDGTMQKIYQNVVQVGGKAYPSNQNNGCEMYHPCRECELCRMAAMFAELKGFGE